MRPTIDCVCSDTGTCDYHRQLRERLWWALGIIVALIIGISIPCVH